MVMWDWVHETQVSGAHTATNNINIRRYDTEFFSNSICFIHTNSLSIKLLKIYIIQFLFYPFRDRIFFFIKKLISKFLGNQLHIVHHNVWSS